MVFDKNQKKFLNSQNKKIHIFLFTLNIFIFNKKTCVYYTIVYNKKQNKLKNNNFYGGNGNSNDYLYLAFLAQNGEGTLEERSEKNGHDERTVRNGTVTVMVQERKNYCILNRPLYIFKN